MSRQVSMLMADARRQAGLTQAELAAAAGTSQSAIARIERGTSTPSFETLERVLGAMGFRLELHVVPVAEPAYVDPVIEAYKQDVDRTLIIENLRLPIPERMAKAEAFAAAAAEVRRAGEAMRLATNRARKAL